MDDTTFDDGLQRLLRSARVLGYVEPKVWTGEENISHPTDPPNRTLNCTHASSLALQQSLYCKNWPKTRAPSCWRLPAPATLSSWVTQFAFLPTSVSKTSR